MGAPDRVEERAVDSASENPMPSCMHKAMLDVMLEPVLIYDDARVLYANGAASELLHGSSETRLDGMALGELILPSLADVNNARRGYVLEQNLRFTGLDVKVRGLDGKPLALRVDIAPISFEGRVAAMATLARE